MFTPYYNYEQRKNVTYVGNSIAILILAARIHPGVHHEMLCSHIFSLCYMSLMFLIPSLC